MRAASKENIKQQLKQLFWVIPPSPSPPPPHTHTHTQTRSKFGSSSSRTERNSSCCCCCGYCCRSGRALISMMNLTSAMPTATRGEFSKNIVIPYLPSVADGFITGIVNRPIRHFLENHDPDLLQEESSSNRLVGITGKHHHLIIVRYIFLKPDFREENSNSKIYFTRIVV